jgi:hypothetical protein
MDHRSTLLAALITALLLGLVTALTLPYAWFALQMYFILARHWRCADLLMGTRSV